VHQLIRLLEPAQCPFRDGQDRRGRAELSAGGWASDTLHYGFPQEDGDADSSAGIRGKLLNSASGFPAMGGWSATLPLPDYGRVARYPPEESSQSGSLALSG
jgi:hypothetical protein